MNLEGDSRMMRKVDRMEDDANVKAAVIAAVHRIPPDFFLKVGFRDEDIDTFHANLEKRFLKHALTNDLPQLRELATEALRDTMQALGIEKPGFRDDFREALGEMMRVE